MEKLLDVLHRSQHETAQNSFLFSMRFCSHEWTQQHFVQLKLACNELCRFRLSNEQLKDDTINKSHVNAKLCHKFMSKDRLVEDTKVGHKTCCMCNQNQIIKGPGTRKFNFETNSSLNHFISLRNPFYCQVTHVAAFAIEFKRFFNYLEST